MMYFIPKLYIQNNISNTTKYENECFFKYSKQHTKHENECFFLYSNSVFEYRIKKMRSGYTNC